MCNFCERGALAGQGMKKGFAVPSPVRGVHPLPGTGRSVTVTELRAVPWHGHSKGATAPTGTQKDCQDPHCPGKTPDLQLHLDSREDWPRISSFFPAQGGLSVPHCRGSYTKPSFSCQTLSPGSLWSRHCQQGEVGTPVPLIADLCGWNP